MQELWARTMNNRLNLDMDGVIADFMGHVYDVVKEETGDQLIHADTVDYWFNDTPHKDLILDIMHREGTYRHLDVITGAVGAINRLREQYDVVICDEKVYFFEPLEKEISVEDMQKIVDVNKKLIKGVKDGTNTISE